MPFVVLLTFVVTLPLGVTWSFGPLDLVDLMVVSAILTTAMMRVAGGLPPWRWHPSAIWLVLLVWLQVASLVTARDPVVAVPALVMSVLGALLGLTVHTLCKDLGMVRVLVTVLVAVGTVVAVHGILTAGTMEAQFAGAGALSGRAVGVFDQPNQLGTFSAVMLMIGVGVALGARSRAEGWLGSACALLSAANLGLSFSRGAWIGAALGAALLFVLANGRQRRRLLKATAVVIAVGVTLTLLLAPQMAALVTERVASIARPGANPDDNRSFIYQEVWRQISQRPLLGQGPGNFEPTSLMTENLAAGVDAMHSHNLILQLAGESGLLAVVALGGLAASLGRGVWRARTMLSGPDAVLVSSLGCAMVAVIGQGMVDFTLGNPILYYLAWTVTGTLLAVTDRRTTSQHVLTQGRLSR